MYRFKWEVAPSTGRGDQRIGASRTGGVQRCIRARLTVRGFKDREKTEVERYAGTSTRSAQKVLVSEAVRRGWDLGSADISKAFLQGVTYEELAELTGQPQREVNFYLPQADIPLLRQIPGFETFDPKTEVLHCNKLGTGLVDAPRAFSIKLGMITQKCGFVASAVDPELCYNFGPKGLSCMMTKHVDELKITGEPAMIEYVVHELQKVFGDLTIQWNSFVHCGVQRTQDPQTKEVALDQIKSATQ